jgi:HD-GYP domain-containing protein (c-di-GMP phosphodiesterase class II)
MQRISAVYAKPGMVIESPVYDYWGDIVLDKDTVLCTKDVATVGDTGIGEIFILNEYTDDLELRPSISPETSGALSRSLRKIMIEARATLTNKSASMIDTGQIEHLVDEVIVELLEANNDDISVSGCFSLKDYNYVHPVKVAIISLLMGKSVGMNATELKNMGMAALLQNTGYVLIPPGILEKPGPLTDSEIQMVQKHPVYGAEILQRYTRIDPEIIDILCQHHERWTGSGYPFQLKQNAICRAAQILGITDTCIALSSKRPHREEFLPVFAIEHSIVSPRDAIEFVLAYSGELFNPDLVRIFASFVPVYPAGVRVKLNNGQEGIVCNTNTGILRRPQVRVFNGAGKTSALECSEEEPRLEDAGRKQAEHAEYANIDLAKKSHRRLFIVETIDY